VRRIIVAFMLAALVALAAAGTAWAKPITITTHDKVTETFTGTLHCHPNERSIVTVTARSTLHITAAGRDAQGNLLPPFHTHSLFQGKFLDVPADGTGPTYTGHFIELETVNARSLDEFVGTYTNIEHATARGSDGSKVRMHVLVRYSVNAKGKVTVDFVKVKREC
jgi:hypothetical protein